MLTTKRIFIIFLLSVLAAIAGLFFLFIPPKEPHRRIGILLYQETPTTLAFLAGLKSSLEEKGYYHNKNLFLFMENLNSSTRTIPSVLKKMKTHKVDLLITTGNELTISSVNASFAKPIIFALVTDPMRNETIEAVDHEKNVTGISFFTPYDRTLELSKRVIPHMQTLTILLPPDSSWQDLDKLQDACDGLNITLQTLVSDSYTEAITKLRGRTDAIYLPNDIKLVMNRGIIRNALIKANIPAISNNLSFKDGCVLTYFADPKTMGEIAGKMVLKIYHGAKVKYMPTELSSHFRLTINLNLMKRFAINVDEDVLSYANEVIQ